jgi:thioredoxin-related protein
MKKLLFAVFIFIVVTGFAAEKVNKSNILSQKGWQEVYGTYRPDDGLIEALKSKIGDNLKIEVYLAYWCGDSRNNVHKFLKIIDKINDSKLKENYYTVKRKPTKDTKYFVEKLKVERVPTFIFYREGKEIGRIIENPKTDMLEDFLEIVF